MADDNKICVCEHLCGRWSFSHLISIGASASIKFSKVNSDPESVLNQFLKRKLEIAKLIVNYMRN
jgi:hypothetical protein